MVIIKKLTLSFIVGSKSFSNNAPLYCLNTDGLSHGPHSRYTTGLLFKETHCKLLSESEPFCDDIDVRTSKDFFSVD